MSYVLLQALRSDPRNLGKLCFGIDVVDNETSSFKNNETHRKRQQYVENVLTEVMLYPMIIIAIVGFATEKMYLEPANTLGYFQIVFLCLDTIYLFGTQIIRMYMFYKLLKDLKKIMGAQNPILKDWSLAG